MYLAYLGLISKSYNGCLACDPTDSVAPPCLILTLGLASFQGSLRVWDVQCYTGLLSNQGEKSINFYFIMVPLRKKY